MNNNDAVVLELLASRICHDLISPVGAVHNGVEFMQDMGIGEGMEDAVALIAHSAHQASAKLQVYRIAYGAGGRDPNITPEDVYKAFDNMIMNDGKITQDWDSRASLFGDSERPLGFCKVLMGAMLLAMETLLKGGTIGVSAAGNNIVHVSATGDGATLRPQVEEALALALAPDSLDPRLVHPYVLALIARQYGFVMSIDKAEDGKIVFAITQG